MSLARKPGLRSSKVPWGFDPLYLKTSEGTLFATQCMVLAVIQWLVGNYFCIEQPLGGFMKWLHCWMVLFAMGAYEDWSPQCRWIKTKEKYRKDTIFMHNHPGLGKLSGFCTCKRKHIQLMGSLTTLAAAYPEGLSEEVVGGIKDSFPNTPGPWGIPDGDERLSLHRGSAADTYEANDEHPEVCLDALDPDQFTRPLHYLRPGSKPYVVSLSESLPWSVTRKCRPRRKGHINLQEQRAWRLVLKCSKRGCRVYGLQDYRVNIGAGTKGRSPSQSLNRLLVRSAAIILGRGLYPRSDHVPTWSIRADDPSRDKPLRGRRAAYPPWLRLCAAGDRHAAEELLDAATFGSKALNRWVQFTLELADRARVDLGDFRVELGASGCAPPPASPEGIRRGAPRRGHQRPRAATASSSARPFRRLAECGCRGDSGGAGASEPPSFVRALGGVLVPALRDALEQRGGPPGLAGHRGHAQLDAESTCRALASAAELGAARARQTSSPTARCLAESLGGDSNDLELAASCFDLIAELFRAASSERELWAVAKRLSSSERPRHGGVPASPDSGAQVSLGVRTSAIRPDRARGASGLAGVGAQQDENELPDMARIAGHLLQSVEDVVEGVPWQRRFGVALRSPDRGGDFRLSEIRRRLGASALARTMA